MVDPATYQTMFKKLPTAYVTAPSQFVTITHTHRTTGSISVAGGVTAEEIKSLLARCYVHCVAAGKAGNATRLFLYASVCPPLIHASTHTTFSPQSNNAGLFTEAQLDHTTNVFSCNIKCEQREMADNFLKFMTQAMSQV